MDRPTIALRPPRTLLFTPADAPRKCLKAWSSGADAVILDLEDAVAPAAKDDARRGLSWLLAERRPSCAAFVRVNAPDTDAGRRDLDAVAGLPIDALVVPKAELARVALAAGRGLPLIALVETARGVLDAERIAALADVALLMFGPVDLTAELGCEPLPDGAELLFARSRVVVAAAAAGLPGPIDGPCLALDDADALRAETERARRLGFAGKACIHPRQLPDVAEMFTPSAEQLAWARRVADAYGADAGVVSVDGQMVDAPVARRAHAILERAETTHDRG